MADGKIIILNVDGSEEVIPISGSVPFEKLQQIVGGFVTVIRGWNKYDGESCKVICNEDAGLKGFSTNLRATKELAIATGLPLRSQLFGVVAILLGSAKKGL